MYRKNRALAVFVTVALLVGLSIPMLAFAEESDAPDLNAATAAESEAAHQAAADHDAKTAAAASEAPSITVRYDTDPDEGAAFATNLRYLFWKDSGMLVVEKVDANDDAWFAGDDFEGREDIKSVRIGEGVDLSNNWIFYNCNSLETVYLPASLEYITFHVFEGCTSLKDVYYDGTVEQWQAVTIEADNESLAQANIHCSDGDTAFVLPERMNVSLSDIKSLKFYSPRPIFAGFDELDMGIAADATMADGTVYYLDFGYEYEYDYEKPYGGLYQLNNLIWGMSESDSISIELVGGTIDKPGEAQAKITLCGDLASVPYNSTVTVKVVENPVKSLSLVGDETITCKTGEIEYMNYTEESLVSRRDVMVHYADGTTQTINDILDYNGETYGGWSGWAWDDGFSCSDFIMDPKVSGEDFNEALRRHGSERHRIEYSMNQNLADMAVGQSYPVTIRYMGSQVTSYVKIVEGEYTPDDNPDGPGSGDDPDDPGSGDDPDDPGSGDDPDDPGSGDDPGTGNEESDPVTPVTPTEPDPAQLTQILAPSGALLTYNGKSQSGVEEGEGYTLSGTIRATNAGTYTTVATLRSGYCWSDGSTAAKDIVWSIGKLDISNAAITLSSASATYNGSAFKPGVTSVKVGGITISSSSYSVSYSSGCVNAGSYKATVTARGENCTGSASASFTIAKASLNGASVTAPTQTIDKPKIVNPAATVTVGGRALKVGTDYDIAYENNSAPGTAKMTITGKGNYTGTASGAFTIKGATSTERPQNMRSLAYFKAAKSGSTLTYAKGLSFANSDAIKVPGLVHAFVNGKFCDHMIPQGMCVAKNYLLISAYCPDKTHSSVIYVLDKNSGAFKGTLELNYCGSPFTETDGGHVGGITFDNSSYVYVATSGLVISNCLQEARVPLSMIDNAVKYGNYGFDIKNDLVKLEGSSASERASFNTYYDGKLWVGYCNSGGNGHITGYSVSGKKATQKIRYTIGKNANGAAFVKYANRTFLLVNRSDNRDTNATMYIYSLAGASNKTDLTKSAYLFASNTMPPMMEEIALDGTTLYTLSESGAAKYRGDAKEITDAVFKGDVTKLLAGQVSIANAAVSKISDATYTGSAIKPTPTVSVGKITGVGTKNLVKDNDYTLSYSANTKVGTAKVTIKGKGIFKGSITKTFKIKKASVKKATVTVSNVTYNGKVQTPTPKVVVGKTTLKKGTDYTLTYKNNKNAGTATVTVKGAGGYGDSINKTFKVNKAANPMTAKSISCPTFKMKDLKKKKLTVASSISVKKAQGKVTYKKVSGSNKISVDSKTGKITVAKGTGKALYKIQTKVTAAGSGNYQAKSITVTETIKVA